MVKVSAVRRHRWIIVCLRLRTNHDRNSFRGRRACHVGSYPAAIAGHAKWHSHLVGTQGGCTVGLANTADTARVPRPVASRIRAARWSCLQPNCVELLAARFWFGMFIASDDPAMGNRAIHLDEAAETAQDLTDPRNPSDRVQERPAYSASGKWHLVRDATAAASALKR